MRVRVRSRGPGDVVVRYAGRRLRITPEWGEISGDQLEAVLEREEGDMIEVDEEVDVPGRGDPPKSTEAQASGEEGKQTESTGDPAEQQPKSTEAQASGEEGSATKPATPKKGRGRAGKKDADAPSGGPQE